PELRVFLPRPDAFPKDRQDGRVAVSYQIDGSDWKLVVSDNGIGKPDAAASPAKGGLGTVLVKALAQDLDAKVEVISGPGGVNVSLTHAALPSRLLLLPDRPQGGVVDRKS